MAFRKLLKDHGLAKNAGAGTSDKAEASAPADPEL